MAKIIKTRDYTVGPDDAFVFDTNVWLLLYGPVANVQPKKQQQYASLLRQIRERQAVIFITSLIISEYINRALRIEFDLWKNRTGNTNADFKHDFRPTGDYLQVLEDTKNQVLDILGITQRDYDNFHNENISSILNRMSDKCDYNDSYILGSCKRLPAKLVSDDKDMKTLDYPITLITI